MKNITMGLFLASVAVSSMAWSSGTAFAGPEQGVAVMPTQQVIVVEDQIKAVLGKLAQVSVIVQSHPGQNELKSASQSAEIGKLRLEIRETTREVLESLHALADPAKWDHKSDSIYKNAKDHLMKIKDLSGDNTYDRLVQDAGVASSDLADLAKLTVPNAVLHVNALDALSKLAASYSPRISNPDVLAKLAVSYTPLNIRHLSLSELLQSYKAAQLGLKALSGAHSSGESSQLDIQNSQLPKSKMMVTFDPRGSEKTEKEIESGDTTGHTAWVVTELPADSAQ